MIVKILLILALAGTAYVVHTQGATIDTQRAIIEEMVSVPGCMADPGGLPGHRVPAPNRWDTVRHFVANPPQRSI